MGKWGKYLKHYNPKWEKELKLKNWLEPSSEEAVLKGMPEAHCRFCQVHLRAHHNDLIQHADREKHKQRERNCNRSVQPNLLDLGCHEISDQNKIADLTLAIFIASHCSVQSIDHLGEILKFLGKGSVLEKTKLHRTKTSKLISAVIAPVFLTELVNDIQGEYALIVDEATDISSSKFLGMCVRYFSRSKSKFITDFLGLVEVTDCTAETLAAATKEYLKKINLPLERLHSVGTDGAPVMCGQNHSFYTELKKDLPNLVLLKCVCHSLEKCAEYAFKKVPNHLHYILSNAHNWFAHSAKKLGEYTEYYKTINNGNKPKKILSLSLTRWLIWLPVSESVLEQWTELQGFLSLQSKNDFMATQLATLMKDNSNKLYLTFMNTMLKPIQKMNLAFEHSNADVTKLYSDLRSLVFSVASRILQPQAIAETCRAGSLRTDEVKMLQNALANPANHLPLDRVNFGDAFNRLFAVSHLSVEEAKTLRQSCGEYIICLCNQLIERLPANLDSIKKLKFLSPRFVFAKVGRPIFQQLPIEFAQKGVDKDVIDEQWLQLGMTSILDVCPHPEFHENIEIMDINHFWACVYNCKNAGGEQCFKELACFALKALTLPISNADVERVFSVLSCIKTRHRNKLQLLMLESLMRLRVHLKVEGKCCRNFVPNKAMLNRFTSQMYLKCQENDKSKAQLDQVFGATEELEDQDYQDIATLFNSDSTRCMTI